MKLRARLAAGLAVLGMAVLAACGGGGSGGGASGPNAPGANPNPPVITPTAFPSTTSTPSTGSTLVCRSSGTPQSVARATTDSSVPMRLPGRRGSAEFVPSIIEITYRSGQLLAHRTEASQMISGIGGHVRTELDTTATGDRIQIVSVAPGSEDDALRQLRANSLVQSAERSAARYKESTTAVLTNDPFFQGFAPFNVPPLYQSSSVGGQWDMHVICAANAWGYGAANTSGATFAGALGGNARIAIVDTGADLTHPDLQNRVVYAETVLNGVVTPGTGAMHDNDGHGTNVAGIAAATGNNSVGFTGVAYAAPLMIFRVFPDPPQGGCQPGSTSSLCTASGADVGTAILDAVNNGAKVINLSLGAGGPDTAEESAVATAVAHGVVVIAASGNEASSTLDYPAADPGVIAVGASSLDDSNSANIIEGVASYTNYSAAAPSTWGLVAPGGDPVSGDPDDLHWIEGIFTSTSTDPSLGSACRVDPGSSNGITDCRILIAGTSQATPHVTGAVALLLSINPTLSPASVKTVLCSSARAIVSAKSGCGRLDVYRALARVVNDPSP